MLILLLQENIESWSFAKIQDEVLGSGVPEQQGHVWLKSAACAWNEGLPCR